MIVITERTRDTRVRSSRISIAKLVQSRRTTSSVQYYGKVTREEEEEEERGASVEEAKIVGKSPSGGCWVSKARALVTKGDLIWRTDQNENMAPA